MRLLCLAAVCLMASATLSAAPPDSFTLTDITGAEHTLPQEQEGTGIYFFWASWCPYCKALMPHLQSIVDEYGDRVTVYALNFRDDNDPSELMDANGYRFVVLPEAGGVAEDWGVRGTPGLFIVDQGGSVRFNLYDVVADNPPGYDELSHSQKAARRAPFWAARIRAALDAVASGSTSRP